MSWYRKRHMMPWALLRGNEGFALERDALYCVAEHRMAFTGNEKLRRDNERLVSLG